VQGSVRLNLYNEPEPDIVLLRPRADFYASRLPGPADILLIIEIAESSIDYDREVKARVYAGAGVPEYWLADLTRNLVTCYSDPAGAAYRNVRACHTGQSIAPGLLADCTIEVDVLLAQ
jgi:Uma2 family endonuclease